MINMTLLKAYLFNTDDPILMLKCWLEELQTIKKSTSNVSYKTVFAQSLQEESDSERIELIDTLKTLLDEHDKYEVTRNKKTGTKKKIKLSGGENLESFFDSKAIAGPKRIRRAKKAKGKPTYVDTKDPYGTAYEENLFKIKMALNRFKSQNENAEVINVVNRIMSALDKKIKRVQVLTPATQGKKRKEVLDEIEYEMKRLQSFVKTSPNAKKTIKDYNKYNGLYRLLDKIHSNRNYIESGEVIGDKFTFNKTMTDTLDRLFDYGPTIISNLDDIKERKFIEKIFDGTSIPLNGKELQDKFTKILTSKIVLPVTKGGAKETMDMDEGLQFLHKVFTGSTPFKSRKEMISFKEGLKTGKTKSRASKVEIARRSKQQKQRLDGFNILDSDNFNKHVGKAKAQLAKYIALGKDEIIDSIYVQAGRYLKNTQGGKITDKQIKEYIQERKKGDNPLKPTKVATLTGEDGEIVKLENLIYSFYHAFDEVFLGENLSREEFKKQLYEGSDGNLKRKYPTRYTSINDMLPKKEEKEDGSEQLLEELLTQGTLTLNSPKGKVELKRPRNSLEERE